MLYRRINITRDSFSHQPHVVNYQMNQRLRNP